MIPADKKWFARLAVAASIIDTIETLNPQFPEVDPKLRHDFKVAKAALQTEGPTEGPRRPARPAVRR